MARRSRRKSAKRRHTRRRHAVGALAMNSPRRATHRRRGHKRRNPARRHTFRRHARRNPPGILGGLMGAAVDGLTVTGGVIVQNGVVRYVPDILPATMSNAAILNPLVKDVLGVIGGAYAFHRMFGSDRARFVVAGQAHAAIARLVRAANVPVVSTMLGEYDPIRLGTYRSGIVTQPVVRALPAPPPSNVATLKRFGVYTDGMSTAPGLF